MANVGLLGLSKAGKREEEEEESEEGEQASSEEEEGKDEEEGNDENGEKEEGSEEGGEEGDSEEKGDEDGEAGEATALMDKSKGRSAKDQGKSMQDHLSGAASHAEDLVSMVPGSHFTKGAHDHHDVAMKMWASDVPGGFQIGESADIHPSDIPGMEGFVMSSFPDGMQFFVSEDAHWSQSFCCWWGAGPSYHVYRGDPLHGSHVLSLHAHKAWCCASPDVDVLTPNGKELATVDEDGFICCANTRVEVHGQERYLVKGLFCGTCCCCSSSHEVRDMHRHRVGRIVHAGETMHIDFPHHSWPSDKAGLVAAALLSELRTGNPVCSALQQ